MNILRCSIPVYGLACGGGGALTVERALARMPGVLSVYVNPATETAEVEVDDEQVGLEALSKAIKRCGFRPGKPQFLTAGGHAGTRR